MHRPDAGKDNPGIAAGMGASEVVEVDLVLARAQLHFVCECFLREKLRLVAFEVIHLLHEHLGIRMGNDIDRCWKLLVAAHVIVVGMRIDDHGDWLRRHRLDLVENRLAIARILGIDHNDAGIRDEHTRVPAAAENHVQVVFHLLNIERLWRRLSASNSAAPALARRRILKAGRPQRQCSESQQQAQHNSSFHEIPPGKKTR